jgi:tRNA dimethylallyltransferase
MCPARKSTSTTALPLLLAGPTACGKSEVALLLAEQVGGEIVSVDSMQVYRGLDIGTAKPSPEERARLPHHLIDVAELTDPFDAARFSGLASKAVGEILQRGRLPILCGGTGLYFSAFLNGLGGAPSADPALRTALEATPMDALLRELAALDPVTFSRIDRQNPRRVVRAVEVLRLTGRPISDQRAEWNPAHENRPVAGFICLSREPEDLRRRIDARVDAMFARGLVEETRRLMERGLEENRTAMQAIGYRQVVGHLRGEQSLAQTVDLVKIRTRQYARRQMTWFRRQSRVTWLEVKDHESAERIVERIPCRT